MLAFELDTAEGELPPFHPDWRWEDQEHAVLSACSSLIIIVNNHDTRVVQFSHFSVKEYLVSNRLSTACVDVSQYHIALEPAHLVLARACLGVLFNLHESGHQSMPLLWYAIEYWTSHAQVGNVSSYLKDVMQTLFDWKKPHFEAWRKVYNTYCLPQYDKSPLYCAALHGFHDIVQHLINGHPEQITHHNDADSSPLFAALQSRKHVRIAELLVQHGAHVHIRGDPPLYHVIRFSADDRINAVQFLLKHGAHVNAGTETLWTPLHHAAQVGCPEVARILLEYGADVGLQNNVGMVPLHLVSDRNHGNMIEDERLILARLLLGKRCVDVNAQDMFGDTPLHYASENRRPKIAQLLLHHGADAHSVNFRSCNPLHQMSQFIYKVRPYDICRVTQLLLELGVDVNVQDKEHRTPLHISAARGLLENTQLLLYCGAKADAENVYGHTALHLASRTNEYNDENRANVVRLLLKIGTDVNVQDKHQKTPLHFASSCGNFEVTLALLDHGANVNARDANGLTPLHRVSPGSVPYHDPHSLAQLLLKRGAEVNAKDENQETPLHSASCMLKLEIARVLLDHGANIHAKNVRGQTSLHLVSRGDGYDRSETRTALVELLLSRGADVDARDEDQMTPFLWSVYWWKPKIAEILLQNGAEVNAVNIHRQNALHIISKNRGHNQREEELISLFKLLGGVDINGRDNDERTPLHVASYCGRVDVAKALLEHAVQVNAKDLSGYTPLHEVTFGKYYCRSFGLYRWRQKDHLGKVLHLAEILLESGANIDAQNKDRETPLHLASHLRFHDMARLLLKHGADVNVKNSEGKYPFQVATRRKGKAMRRLLSKCHDFAK